MVLFGPSLFEGFVFETLCHDEARFLVSLVVIVFVSVLLMFLFDCSLFEGFVFETLCHKDGFLASFVGWLFWYCFW